MRATTECNLLHLFLPGWSRTREALVWGCAAVAESITREMLTLRIAREQRERPSLDVAGSMRQG